MKSASRTDNCTASAFLTYKKLLNEVHDLAVMGGVQYDYAAYDYSATKVMDVESAIESLMVKDRFILIKLISGKRLYCLILDVSTIIISRSIWQS